MIPASCVVPVITRSSGRSSLITMGFRHGRAGNRAAQGAEPENREIIAFHAFEKLHPPTLEPIGADRVENRCSFLPEIGVEKAVTESPHG